MLGKEEWFTIRDMREREECLLWGRQGREGGCVCVCVCEALLLFLESKSSFTLSLYYRLFIS